MVGKLVMPAGDLSQKYLLGVSGPAWEAARRHTVQACWLNTCGCPSNCRLGRAEPVRRCPLKIKNCKTKTTTTITTTTTKLGPTAWSAVTSFLASCHPFSKHCCGEGRGRLRAAYLRQKGRLSPSVLTQTVNKAISLLCMFYTDFSWCSWSDFWGQGLRDTTTTGCLLFSCPWTKGENGGHLCSFACGLSFFLSEPTGMALCGVW